MREPLHLSACVDSELIWFGKLPGAGDFLRRDLGCVSGIDAVDEWLSSAILHCQKEKAERFQEAWMTQGVLRFESFDPQGLDGQMSLNEEFEANRSLQEDPLHPLLQGLAPPVHKRLQGVLAPSVDRCGRLFPFLLATLSEHSVLDWLQSLVVSAIDDDWTEKELLLANQSLKEQTRKSNSLNSPGLRQYTTPATADATCLRWWMPDMTELQTKLWPSLTDFEILFGLSDR